MLKKALLFPSFYGFIMFFIFGILYLTKPFKYDDVRFETIFFILFTSFSFFIATLHSIFNYRIKPIKKTNFKNRYLILFFLIGIYGLYLYLTTYSNFLGGYLVFFTYIVEGESLNIRAAAEYLETFGTQLTYFGWFFISLAILNSTNNIKYLPLIIITFFGNLLYIDRTRPIWIIFTTLLSGLPYIYNKFSSKKLFIFLIIIPCLALLLFNFIGDFIGKKTISERFGESYVPENFQNAVMYLTSGYGYFNHLIKMDITIEYIPSRTLYPLFKVLSFFNITNPPPGQVLEFYYVPFPTNVGTFLEPYYQDGGIFYCLIGILFHSFGFNLLSVWLFKHNSPLSILLWSNLCFTNLMSNFTPKISSFPIWLLFLLFLLEYLLSKFRVSNESIISN